MTYIEEYHNEIDKIEQLHRTDGDAYKQYMENRQKTFLKLLENYPDGATIYDIRIDTGEIFTIGMIMFLKALGLIEATECTVEMNRVYRDTVIGTMTWTVHSYKLKNHEADGNK